MFEWYTHPGEWRYALSSANIRPTLYHVTLLAPAPGRTLAKTGR